MLKLLEKLKWKIYSVKFSLSIQKKDNITLAFKNLAALWAKAF